MFGESFGSMSQRVPRKRHDVLYRNVVVLVCKGLKAISL